MVDTDTRALGCNNGTLFEAHDGMRLGGAYMTELLFEGCARTSARALPTSWDVIITAVGPICESCFEGTLE